MESNQANLIFTLFEKINLAIFILNSDLRYENINTKGLELLHVTKEDVLGKKFADLYPDALQTKFGKHLQLVRKTGSPQEWEFYSVAAKQWLRVNAYNTTNTIILLFTNINKQHYLEELLEERVRLLDMSFDAIQMLDEENKIFYWNKGAERVYGWKAHEIIGKVGYKIFHTNLPGGYVKFLKNLRKTKQWKGILDHVTKSGKHIIVESAWSLIERNGKTAIMEINRDVTKEELAKHQVLQNEKKFRSLIENSQDAIVVTDEKLNFLYISPSIKNVLGYTPDEFKKIQIPNIIHPDDFPVAMKDNKEILREKKTVSNIYRVKNKKGAWLYIRSRSENLLSDETIGGLVTTFRDITDVLTAREKIEASEKRFRTLIENSSDVTMVTNAKGKITYVSPSVERIFGYTPEEFLKLTLKKTMHPEDAPKSLENLQQLLTSKTKQTSGQYRIKNKKREYRWIETKAKNLLDDPAVQGIVSNFRDITDEKQYQEEIETWNKKITEILENFNYAYYAIDRNWHYTYINKEAQKLAQLKKEDMLGKSVWEIFPDIKDLESGRAMKKVMENRVAEEYDVYYPPYKKWYHHYMTPISQGIALYAYDITERKNIEQQIFDTQQELEAILTHIPSGIIVRNVLGHVIYANKEGIRLSDYQTLEEMQKAAPFDFMYKFDLRDEYGRKFSIEDTPGRVALKTGKNSQTTLKLTNKQTGVSRWVTISATVIYKGHEKNPLIVNVLQDVTELKEADVRKNDFISMASHELKTPLTSLKVYMQLLASSRKIEETQKKEYIVKASEQVDKLQQLVSELLDQSTIQQGKLSLHLQEMYFDFFVREFITNFRQTTDGVVIDLKGETHSIVTIDKFRIEQVLANLLSNAIKYSKDKKEVQVHIAKKGKAVWLSVKDFGIGIPPTERDNIFKPYYRVIGKKENTFPGMGMGLYISKDIIDKHGGDIFVESSLGKGATFTITLPVVD